MDPGGGRGEGGAGGRPGRPPLLIDATLPVCRPLRPGEVGRHAAEWRGLLGGLGVGMVKAPGDPPRSPRAVAVPDRAFLGDYRGLFAGLGIGGPGEGETVFEDGLGCATALAAAWLESGGAGVLCSVGGAGGLPALERLRLMLHVTGLLPLAGPGGRFRRVRELYELLSGGRTPFASPVLGEGVFAVESGIHVDGIAKDPALYEPFPPELVGARRILVMGLHSGRSSLRLKCACLGIEMGEGRLPGLLALVKARALELGRGLTDGEFLALCRGTAAGGGAAAGGGTPGDGGAGGGAPGGGAPGGPAGGCGAPAGPAGGCGTAGGGREVGIVDTTLRDGQQSPGLVFSAAAKESMIAGLDGAGVARIEEAGPAMGPVACSRPLRSLVRNAEIVLWNRLLESDVEASLAADPHVIHVCLPVSERHLERKLGVSWDRAARLLEGAVRLAGSEGHRVSVGLEDASRAGPGSLGRAMGLLSDVGARHVRLSDTAGVLTPGRTRELVGLFKAGGFTVEFHAHDDLGLADANSLQAALAGADYVDVTLCGIGERAGNASLGGFARLAGSAPGLGLAVGAGEAAALEGAFRHLFGREWLSGAGRGPAAGGPGAASPARGRGRR